MTTILKQTHINYEWLDENKDAFSKIEIKECSKMVSKEAEDVAFRSLFKLERQASVPQLLSDDLYGRLTLTTRGAFEEEQDDIEGKCANMWDCVGRRRVDCGKYVYKYRLKNEYDRFSCRADLKNSVDQNVRAKNRAIYPALELEGTSLQEIGFLSKAAANELLKRDEFGDGQISWELEVRLCIFMLGYRLEKEPDGIYVFLPDRETLLARWEILREIYPDLPQLDVLSSEGVASELTIIEAFFTHDVVISKGAEFFHDHARHAIPRIKSLLALYCPNNQKKIDLRARFEKMVMLQYRKVAIVKNGLCKIPWNDSKESLSALQRAVDGVLSILVDTAATSLSEQQASDLILLNRTLTTKWYGHHWERYFSKRFNLSISKINNHLALIESAVSRHDLLRSQEGLLRQKVAPVDDAVVPKPDFP